MIIKGSIFQLTPINEHSLRYDLELLYDIGGKNPRQEFKNAGYGLPLDTAIKKIITYATNKKLGDEIVTFKQFLNTYKEESDKIRTELKEVMS